MTNPKVSFQEEDDSFVSSDDEKDKPLPWDDGVKRVTNGHNYTSSPDPKSSPELLDPDKAESSYKKLKEMFGQTRSKTATLSLHRTRTILMMKSKSPTPKKEKLISPTTTPQKRKSVILAQKIEDNIQAKLKQAEKKEIND